MKVFSLVSVILFGQVGFCQENHRVSNPLIFQEIHMDYQPMEVILDSLATHFKVKFVNPQNFNDIASLQGCIDEGLSVLLRRMALFHPFRFISTDTAIIILPLKDGERCGELRWINTPYYQVIDEVAGAYDRSVVYEYYPKFTVNFAGLYIENLKAWIKRMEAIGHVHVVDDGSELIVSQIPITRL